MANAKGIDVSHWQTSTPSLTGRDFLIAKASEGLTKDKMYWTHVKNARAAGLLVGAYAFNRDDVDIINQADFFAAAAGDVDMYAIDVEPGPDNVQFSPAQTAAFIKRFKAVTGKRIGLYISAGKYSNFKDCGQDWNWIAHWGVDEPSISRWHIHQYRGSPLDLDQFNGTIEEMRAFFATEAGGTPVAFQQVNIPKGTWLYVSGDFSSSDNNIQVSPGRPMLLVKPDATTGGHMVMHDTNFRHYYVRKSAVTLTPLITAAECPAVPVVDAAACQTFSDAAYASGFETGKTEGVAAGYATGFADGKVEGINTGVEAEQTRMRELLGL